MSSKLFIAVILSAVAMVLSDDAEKKEIVDKFEEYRKECIQETGFSGGMVPKDVETMSEPAKCYVACMAQKSGELSKGGFNMEKMNANIEKLFGETQYKDKMKEIMDTCTKEVDVIENNLCETAYQMLLCERRMFKNQGMA